MNNLSLSKRYYLEDNAGSCSKNMWSMLRLKRKGGGLEVVLYVDTKTTKERVENPSLSPSIGQKIDFDIEVEISDEFSFPDVPIT
ncbi:hypothetical protein SLA2020_123300 [Shorea laevis]